MCRAYIRKVLMFPIFYLSNTFGLDDVCGWGFNSFFLLLDKEKGCSRANSISNLNFPNRLVSNFHSSFFHDWLLHCSPPRRVTCTRRWWWRYMDVDENLVWNHIFQAQNFIHRIFLFTLYRIRINDFFLFLSLSIFLFPFFSCLSHENEKCQPEAGKEEKKKAREVEVRDRKKRHEIFTNIDWKIFSCGKAGKNSRE